VLLVKNESDRLVDALASVAFAEERVVVDTGSEDGSPELARRLGARVVSVPWEGYVRSRNRALAEVTHDWTLVLDADERVTPPLREEIERALADGGGRFAGFRMPRLSRFFGRDVRHGTWYPDVKLRLGRRSRAFRAEGGRVHERLEVDGPVGRFRAPLAHLPYRDVSDGFRRAVTYARLGAEDRFERGARASALGLVARPLWEFVRCYVLRRGFLDGSAGVAVASLYATSYVLRAAYLLELEKAAARAVPAPGTGESPNAGWPKEAP
jgi:glycosyltransferase involved in cell wall biosynthesis